MDAKLLATLKKSVAAGVISEADFREITGYKVVRSEYKGKCSYRIESPDGSESMQFMGAKAQLLLSALDSGALDTLREIVTRDALNQFAYKE